VLGFDTSVRSNISAIKGADPPISYFVAFKSARCLLHLSKRIESNLTLLTLKMRANGSHAQLRNVAGSRRFELLSSMHMMVDVPSVTVLWSTYSKQRISSPTGVRRPTASKTDYFCARTFTRCLTVA